MHVHGHKARLYTGGYSSFESQRTEQLAGQAAQYENQQRRLAHLQSFVDRFRAKAARSYPGGFAFQGDRVFEPARMFSGGERDRLALALSRARQAEPAVAR